MQKLLGDDYEVVQEGLCGRIASNCDQEKPYRNGRTGFEIALRSASPVDCVIIALGGNDFKKQYGLTTEQIIDNLLWYDDYAKSYALENQRTEPYRGTIYVGLANIRLNDKLKISQSEVHEFNEGLGSRTKWLIAPDNFSHGVDGLHYSAEDHQKLARLLYKKVLEMDRG